MISQSLIKQLKEKGVDPAIILDLVLEEQDTPAEPAAPADPAVPAAPEASPAQAAPAEPAPQTDPILAAIEKLTGAIQASNILTAGSQGPQAVTTEDALAALINPKGGK